MKILINEEEVPLDSEYMMILSQSCEGFRFLENKDGELTIDFKMEKDETIKD